MQHILLLELARSIRHSTWIILLAVWTQSSWMGSMAQGLAEWPLTKAAKARESVRPTVSKMAPTTPIATGIMEMSNLAKPRSWPILEALEKSRTSG